MAMDTETSSTPAADEPIVRIAGLWSVFGEGENAFAVHQDLDLDVQRGEMLSIVGGSGTGKTVLLRQMLGLLEPTKGRVEVLGRPASEMGREGAASRVGMLFQHGALYSAFSVLDNVAFALREQGTLPDDLVRDAALVKLQMVGLKPEHASRMPADLSGGMIKRVALARALIMDPPLLLLDEPTAGLDPISSDEFCELLRELRAELGLTVIMVTHDLDTLFALSRSRTTWTRCSHCPRAWPCWPRRRCWSAARRARWPSSSIRSSSISSRASAAGAR